MLLVHVTATQYVLLISKVFFISQTRICKFRNKANRQTDGLAKLELQLIILN